MTARYPSGVWAVRAQARPDDLNGPGGHGSIPERHLALGSIAGSIFDMLGEEIAHKQIVAGTVLKEPALMERYGVSRTTVRAAVKMLAVKGMVQSRQRVGATVLPSSRWSLLDRDVLRWILQGAVSPALWGYLCEMRESIEVQAVVLATSAQDKAIAASVSDPCDRTGLDNGRGAKASFHFHRAVLTACANPFAQTCGLLILQALCSSGRLTEDRHRPELPALRAAVAAAIDAGDAAASRAAMMQILQIEFQTSDGDAGRPEPRTGRQKDWLLL